MSRWFWSSRSPSRDESSLKQLVGTRHSRRYKYCRDFPPSSWHVAFILVAFRASSFHHPFSPIHSFENSLLLIQRSFTSFESCHHHTLHVSQLWSNDKFYFRYSRGARFLPQSGCKTVQKKWGTYAYSSHRLHYFGPTVRSRYLLPSDQLQRKEKRKSLVSFRWRWDDFRWINFERTGSLLQKNIIVIGCETPRNFV